MLVQIHSDANLGMAHRLGNDLGLNPLAQRLSGVALFISRSVSSDFLLGYSLPQ